LNFARLEAALTGRLGSCSVEIFSLTPGSSRVRKVCEEKKPFKRFFFGAFVVHRVKTRC
jgi:hypothetical protein